MARKDCLERFAKTETKSGRRPGEISTTSSFHRRVWCYEPRVAEGRKTGLFLSRYPNNSPRSATARVPPRSTQFPSSEIHAGREPPAGRIRKCHGDVDPRRGEDGLESDFKVTDRHPLPRVPRTTMRIERRYEPRVVNLNWITCREFPYINPN